MSRLIPSCRDWLVRAHTDQGHEDFIVVAPNKRLAWLNFIFDDSTAVHFWRLRGSMWARFTITPRRKDSVKTQ